jgi:hypothetical protein
MIKIQIAKYLPNGGRAHVPQVMLNVGKGYPLAVEPVDFGDQGIELCSYGTMLKSYYSAEDIAEMDRLNELVPLNNGDLVQDGEGNVYKVCVRGRYSDAGYLIKQEVQA